MTAKQPSHNPPRGLSNISASQFLIFLLALLCVVVVAQTYESNNAAVTPDTAPAPHSRTQLALIRNVTLWQATLTKQNIALTWPYLNHDFVARIDLPEQRPVTLDAWSYATETKVATDGYNAFVKARQSARAANPESCIVHVFDSTGEEVTRASQGGVITSQYAPIPGTEN